MKTKILKNIFLIFLISFILIPEASAILYALDNAGLTIASGIGGGEGAQGVMVKALRKITIDGLNISTALASGGNVNTCGLINWTNKVNLINGTITGAKCSFTNITFNTNDEVCTIAFKTNRVTTFNGFQEADTPPYTLKNVEIGTKCRTLDNWATWTNGNNFLTQIQAVRSYNWTAGGSAPTNFTIKTIKDLPYNTTILKFNATMVNAGSSKIWNFTTTSGTIITHFLGTATKISTITLKPAGFYNQNISYGYNTTKDLLRNFTNLRRKLNISAYDNANKSIRLSGFSANIKSINSSDKRNFTGSANTLVAWGLTGQTYNVTIDYPSYSYNTTKKIFKNLVQYLNVSLWYQNSFKPTIRDEETSTLIKQNITFSLFSDANTYTYTTKNSTKLVKNISADNYRVDFNGVNYSTRTYYAEIVDRSHTDLNVWLLKTSSGTNIKLNIKNARGAYVEQAVVTTTKFINEAWVTITQKNTGATGFANVFLKQNLFYRILIEATGYTTRLVDLEVSSTETEYTIYLSDTTATEFTSFLHDINYYTTPTSSYINGTNFSLIISSASGWLKSFGLKTIVNAHTYFNNVSGSASGGTASVTINKTTERTPVLVNYFFEINGFGKFSFNKTYYEYRLNQTNSSIQSVADRYKGSIDPFYRLLIAIFGSLIIGLSLVMYITPTGSGLVSLLCFIIFGAIGFISWIYPTILGIMIVGGYIAFGSGDNV